MRHFDSMRPGILSVLEEGPNVPTKFSRELLRARAAWRQGRDPVRARRSTRLNSDHAWELWVDTPQKCGGPMKALIWKEWLENLKWVPLPGLVILLVFFIDKPLLPMPDVTQAFFYGLTAIVFGAALGFVQISFESHGDKRSLLLHRPLSPSRIFLAKALAGVGLYVLALEIPFACLESWYATPGNMPAPYHWRTGLPWLADILSGLVYYFAGMLVAQRDVRWYGSRSLSLATAFFCSYLVWALPEFWQALVAIAVSGSVVAAAAWGSFSAGGAYAPQPRLAKAALAMTFLGALLIVSILGKQQI